jgi:radical SAM protein with 4Fe4S-binding SPASM domain
MDDEKLDFLVRKKVSICTSLDGHKILHDKNRKKMKESNYDKVSFWVKRINEIYQEKNVESEVNALLTVTKESLKYPKEIIDEYLKFGFNKIHLRFLNKIGCASNVWPHIGYSAEEFINFWKKAMDYILELNKKGKEIIERMAVIIIQKAILNFEPNYLELRSPCGAAIGQLLYDYDSKIYSCDEGRMLGDDLFLLGDVNSVSSYSEIMSSPEVCSLVLSSINDSFCDSCVYKPYCGICPVCSYVEKNNIVANVRETTRCKIFMEQFDYIFKKLQETENEKIFIGWAKQ